MNERITPVSTDAPTGRRRGFFAMLAGTLLATTVVVAAPVALDVAHAENWVLQLGPLAGFPRSGTAPFDANTASPVPSPFTTNSGNDQNNTNQVVRSGDTQIYAWSVTASNIDSDAGTAITVNALTVTQIITPDPVGTAPGLGIGVNDLEISPLSAGECPGAGSGIFLNQPAPGQIKVVCNTGAANTGDQTTVTVRVRPKATAPNGARFTSTQSVSATQLNNTPVSPVSYDLDTHPQTKTIYITNRPEWNLSKHGFADGYSTIMDPDGAGPAPSQRGVVVSAIYQISSARPYGNEGLQQPVTVHDMLTLTDNSGNNIVYTAPWYPLDCQTNSYGFPGVVYGHYGGPNGVPGNYQNCTSSLVRDGGDTSPFSFTFPTIDFAPASFPTQYTYGGDLSAGPFFVASVRVAFFIPKDTIDLSDGVMGNGGTVQLFNAVGNFDPNGLSGDSNWNSGVEPGYCSATENGVPVAPNGGTGFCDTMPGGARSDNVIDGSATYTEPGIGGSLNKDTFRNRYSYLPGQTGNKNADGLVEPTMKWFHRVWTYNNSLEPQRAMLCDVFDNSTAVLTQVGPWMNPANPGVENGQYAIVSNEYTSNYTDSVVEYGHVDLTGVDPLSGGYNLLFDRYDGSWGPINTRANTGCDDAVTTWYTDPNSVPGGIDEVNIVRARSTSPAVNNMLSGQNYLMFVPLQARSTFYGGPHNGDSVPDGTIIADRGNRKVYDNLVTGQTGFDWVQDTFQPGPWVYDQVGERVTVRRASISVLKRTVAVDTGYTDSLNAPIISDAASNFDVTGNGAAGSSVVWELTPAIVSELAAGSNVDNVKIVDVLPPGVEYDPVCTSFVSGGVKLPTAVAADTPSAGYTTLTYLLGTKQTNSVLGTYLVCTQTDDFAANGTSYTNQVTLSASGLGSVSDSHTITVAQGSKVKIKKTVDHPLDMLDDNEVWTLQIRNFSQLVTPATPSLLEVYPWNGDATSNNGGLRNPPSAFDGINVLTTMPVATKFDGSTTQTGTFWFTNQAPGAINQDPDGNLAGNATDWCSTPDAGTTWVHEWGSGTVANCPASLADTTGFLFRADTDLAIVDDAVNSGIKITFTLDASGNTPDNSYTDRFSADSPSFPPAQFLRSNIVTVRTVGFQLGDYVWVDANGDGKVSAGEPAVPDGVTVDLYADDDGTPGPSAGDSFVGTTTTVNGVYVFTGLPAGDFYVQIPASEFQPGGLLDGWDITGAAPEASNDDLNDTAGHDGYAGGGDVTVGGVVSNVVTLSAHFDGSGNLIGDEPTLDNTHGISADPFQDGFQNFTLDLAVVGPPAITLVKDVCTQTTAANCEVGDASWDPDAAHVPFNSTSYWRITVTNTGQQDLFPVTITDPVTATCTRTLVSPLKVGQSFSFVCQGAVVTEPPSAPRVNTASVVGNPQAWDPTNSNPNDDVADEDVAEISTTAVSIGDYVWIDLNRDGQQTVGEPAVADGTVVELWDAANTTQLDSTTTSGGYYAFTDLDPGASYTVRVIAPANYTFTTQNQGSDSSDSDANSSGVIAAVAPTNGSNSAAPNSADDPTFDAGLVQFDLSLDKALTSAGPFYAGSTVVFTITPHNNGPVNALPGWKVTDILPAGLTLVSMVGSAGGGSIYTCVGLVCTATATPLGAGADGETIIVTATINAGFTGTAHNVAYISPAAGDITELVPLQTPTTSTNTTSTTTNNDAQADVSVDSLVSVGDYVWLDVNRNGQQDPGETAVSGVTVNIYDGTVSPGNLVGTTTTNGSGFYVFTDLLPGHNYVVEFVAPTGSQFTTQFAAGGTSTDSNANPANGQASVTTPSSGNNSATPGLVDEPTIDAGLVNVDLSISKVLNTAAPIYPGNTVTFTLTPKNNGTTDALTGWTVTEIMPARLTLVSMAGTGGPSIYTCVANVCTANSSLAAGATAETILVTATVNAGPAVTAHNVTYVSPGPGEVTESNPLVIPTTGTDTDFSGTNNDAQADVPVTPLVSVGDYVWFDLNRDGLQTLGELPVQGVTVELLTAGGASIDPDGAGPLTQTLTTTDVVGFYSFTGLLPATGYEIKFTAPSGDTFTTQSGAVSVTNNSDANVATGLTAVFTTPADGSNSAGSPDFPAVDAGLVRVDLALAKAVTSVPPYYEGSTVTFSLTPTNVGNTNALAGWSVTDILPAGLTAVSIAGANGGAGIYTCVLATLTCTSSAPLGIGAAGEQIIVTATINSNFVGSAHNVAYVSPAPAEVTEVIPLITPTTSTNTATTPTNNDAQATVSVDSLTSIGDYVWLDVNRDGQQTVGEPEISGVTVELLTAGGASIDPDGPGPLTQTLTTTDAQGYYFFDDLLPSTDFQVKFTAPAGDQFTTQFTGVAATDSNANPSTGIASVTTPPSGTNGTGHGATDEPTIDAGLVNVDLALAKSLVTTPNYYPGKTVTYTLTPSNLGTTDALAGWSVTEVLPSGMTLVSMSGSGFDCTSLPTCVSSSVLAAGATGNAITVTATIDADVSGPLHNVAYISPAPGEVTETNPLVTPNTSTDTTATDTNNDAQADLTSNIYDLALAKTVTVTGTGEDAVLDYDIIVQNQGTVDSGTYTVVDTIPEGLTVDEASITDGGVYDAGAGTITWTLSGLASGADVTVSWSASVADFTLRPYRNFAEIATDGGAPWGGDNDSTPDTDITNDGNYGPIFDGAIDNQTIDQAGVGDDPSDDADIADATVEINYDLALAKAPSATTIDPAGNVVFTLTVENQGDVNSGEYTITDTLPSGTAATAASDGGVITATTVTWDLTDLAPGATRQVTVTVHITDITRRPFKNIAEISADGADAYDTVVDIKGGDVEDIDSIPDTDTRNDNMTDGFDGYGSFENPTNDIDDIADVDAIPNGEDDADVAFFDAPVLYDLALIKTGPAAIDGAGTATFSITIKNQGNVPSGDYTVTDTVPPGLSATAASDGGQIAGPIVTWDLTGLAPGATRVVTVTMQVTDFLSRPWLNIAEISADSASDYGSDGYENADDGVVTDDDSTPDADSENDMTVDQTVLPVDQFNDPAVDEDDHDVAPIDVNIVYDLALVKVLPPLQSFKKGAPINFQIVVKNQGNVDSGPITVQDVIPAGLAFVSASDGGLNTGQVVTWDLASLAPGATKTVTVTVTVTNSTLASYINLAEIVADGADAYDTNVDDVHDKDSTPDTDITNDPLVDTDDPNIDQVPGDEDDHDRALLDPSKVKKDNSALPPTGSDTTPIMLGFGLLGVGALALVASRRRRRQPA